MLNRRGEQITAQVQSPLGKCVSFSERYFTQPLTASKCGKNRSPINKSAAVARN